MRNKEIIAFRQMLFKISKFNFLKMLKNVVFKLNNTTASKIWLKTQCFIELYWN